MAKGVQHDPTSQLTRIPSTSARDNHASASVGRKSEIINGNAIGGRSLSTDQSMRDASIIAGLVNQLLDEQGTLSSDEPAQLSSTVPIESQKLLDSLRVIDISLYDPTARTLWSTSTGLIAERIVPQSILTSTADGQIASNLSTLEILDDPNRPHKVDVVETYLPLLASGNSGEAEDDAVVGVIGITRDVTSTLTSQINETRSSVSGSSCSAW